MNWLERMEITERSISILGKLWRYFQHGFILGLVVLVVALFGSIGYVYFYFAMILMTPIVVNTLFYGILFALAGGVNQVLAERVWGIECTQNVGTGMRDGFLIILVFGISYSPVNIAFTSVSMWWWHPITPAVAVFLLIVTTPIYMLILGVIGEKLATFLHRDEEPIMPPDFQDRSYECPHCGSSYYYGPDKVSEGQVQCQNCARLFTIISSL